MTTPARRVAARLLLIGAASWGVLPASARAAQADVASSSPVIGLVGGISSAKVLASGSGATVSFDGRSGFLVGVSLTSQVTPELSWEVDGLFVQKGFESSNAATAAFIHVDYLEVPALLRYGLGTGETRPFVAGGASLGVRVSCTAGVSQGGTTVQESCGTQATRQWDYGLVLGGGLTHGPLAASLRYTFGLAEVLESQGLTTRNRLLSLTVGYMLAGS